MTIAAELMSSKTLWLGVIPVIVSYIIWHLKRLYRRIDGALGKQGAQKSIELHFCIIESTIDSINTKLELLLHHVSSREKD